MLYKLKLLRSLLHPYARVAKKTVSGWVVLAEQRFDDQLLQDHLNGKVIYGQVLPPDSKIGFVCLDFDRQADCAEIDFQNHVRKVCSTFLKDGIYFYSSSSQNVHAYFPIKPVIREVLKYKVHSHLSGQGYAVKPGVVELLTNTVRLPLAPGSSCINLRDFSQREPTEADLNRFRLNNRYFLYDLVSRIKGTKHRSVLFDEALAEELLDGGLKTHGTLNNSLVTIACKLALDVTEPDRLNDLLRNWIDNKHNGKSRTYSHSRDAVYKKIDEIVAWIFKKPRIKQQSVVISGALCEQVLEEDISYFGHLRLFNTIKLIKQRSKYRKVIPLSVKALLKRGGCTRKTYQSVIQTLTDWNIIRLVSKGSLYKGHWSYYKVFLPSAEYINQSGYRSWDEFILDQNKINRYSRKTQERLISKNSTKEYVRNALCTR